MKFEKVINVIGGCLVVIACLIIVGMVGSNIGNTNNKAEQVHDIIVDKNYTDVYSEKKIQEQKSNHSFTCEIVPLEKYGFEQVSESKEYVCKNPNDKADFVILVDKQKIYGIGEIIVLNEGDVENGIIEK